MRGALAVAVGLVFLSGCGTRPYTPKEYPLRDGLIPALAVAGAVTVSNAQPADQEFIVHSFSGNQLGSNLKSITDVMVEQTRKELQKNGLAGAGGPKSIALKVDSLVTIYIAMFYKSSIVFQAALGNGQTLNFTVPHSSGNPYQDLDGCIAEGVMTLLRDERVRAYLRS